MISSMVAALAPLPNRSERAALRSASRLDASRGRPLTDCFFAFTARTPRSYRLLLSVESEGHGNGQRSVQSPITGDHPGSTDCSRPVGSGPLHQCSFPSRVGCKDATTSDHGPRSTRLRHRRTPRTLLQPRLQYGEGGPRLRAGKNHRWRILVRNHLTDAFVWYMASLRGSETSMTSHSIWRRNRQYAELALWRRSGCCLPERVAASASKISSLSEPSFRSQVATGAS